MSESESSEMPARQAPRFARSSGARIVFLASDHVVGAQILALLSPTYQIEAVSDEAGALEGHGAAGRISFYATSGYLKRGDWSC